MALWRNPRMCDVADSLAALWPGLSWLGSGVSNDKPETSLVKYISALLFLSQWPSIAWRGCGRYYSAVILFSLTGYSRH